KLMQHDINNNSALLRTLWYYLKMDAKVARTAKALFIHPNTLHYRMNKIKEITMVDLTNMDEKMKLHSKLILIFSILDYYDFYNHPNTLQYRMNKNKEITNVYLTNMDEKMELHSQLILIFSISDYYDFYKNGLNFRAIHQDEED